MKKVFMAIAEKVVLLLLMCGAFYGFCVMTSAILRAFGVE